jgi:hypothetical protein
LAKEEIDFIWKTVSKVCYVKPDYGCKLGSTTHSSDVATGLGKFIYDVGSKSKMDFGTYIFEQTVKHAKTDVVRCPIVFPTLLCGIMLEQHPSLITVVDVPEKREPPLTLHPKLFSADHVPNIVGTSDSAPIAGIMTKQEIIAALKDTWMKGKLSLN